MHVDEATLTALDWSAVCAELAKRTNAEPARRALARWRPLPSREEATTALAEVAEGMDMVASEPGFPAPFVTDLASVVERLGVEGAILEGAELIAAGRALQGTRRLARFLQRGEERWPRLASRFARAPSERELEERILDAFDREARLLDSASPDLARLRGEVRAHRSRLIETLENILARLPHVMVAADSRPTVRDGRYVVPLRREALSEVPGIVHDESTSGATVFLEPREVVDRNNALRQTGLAVRREEERILGELTAALAERRGELEHAARLALHGETVLARARYGLDVDGHPPRLGGETLVLDGARHPMLVARADAGMPGKIVPLDLELGPRQRSLVVSGPNTGGKTVLLKTVGTQVLMAQSGIVPPAGAGTRIPWHDATFADIGDTQSIAQDLSTFTAHLTRLKATLEMVGSSGLVLVDEIGASTDPAEGAALAAALLEEWTRRGARVVVTTHYHALKTLAASNDGIVNGSLAYDLERDRPLYRFVQGVPGRSFGLSLAERWGFGAVVERAREHLDEGVRALDGVIDSLTAEERAYQESRRALDRERKAIGDAESARALRLARQESERREAAERRLSELEGQLERLRAEVRRQQRKVKERSAALAEAEASAKAARRLAEEAEEVARALRSEREALAPEARREAPPDLGVGDRVRIPRYDVTGEIVEADRSEDACAVQAGPVRISCRLSECEPVVTADDAKPSPPREDEDGATAGLVEPALPLEIDLRGLTADEVGFPVAGALERAYHVGNPRIRIIHGKGTGVLRRRVAELLEKHPYVHAFRLGRWGEGGDGVTLVSLAADDEEVG